MLFYFSRLPVWPRKTYFTRRRLEKLSMMHFKRMILRHLQSKLNENGAIEVKPSLVLLEKRGQKGFSFWSKFIASGGTLYSTGRKIRVYTFLYFLLPAIFVLSPLLWLTSQILLFVKRKQLMEDVAYYSQNSIRQK